MLASCYVNIMGSAGNDVLLRILLCTFRYFYYWKDNASCRHVSKAYFFDEIFSEDAYNYMVNL